MTRAVVAGVASPGLFTAPGSWQFRLPGLR